MNKISFVVVSCDKYKDMWDPFFYYLSMNWKDINMDIYLITNELEYKCKYININTIKVGEDKSYSDNLQKALNYIDSEHIFLWIEDLFFHKKINTQNYNLLIDEYINKNCDYLKVGNDMPISYETSGIIGRIPFGVKYRSAIGTAIYKKDMLQKLLLPGKNAWELDTSDYSNDLGENFYALNISGYKKNIFPWVNVLIKGKWSSEGYNLLKESIFDDILNKRKRLSKLGNIYIKLYKIYGILHIKMRRYIK